MMSELLHKFGEHIMRDSGEYVALFGLFIVAAVSNMPTPDKLGNNIWYAWFYNTLQSFLGALRPHPTAQVPSKAGNEQ